MVHSVQCQVCKAHISASDKESPENLLKVHHEDEHEPKIPEATKAYIAQLEANQKPAEKKKKKGGKEESE